MKETRSNSVIIIKFRDLIYKYLIFKKRYSNKYVLSLSTIKISIINIPFNKNHFITNLPPNDKKLQTKHVRRDIERT